MFLFKKKKNKENEETKKRIIIEELVKEMSRRGYSNKQIKEKFKEKNYPDEFIDYLLKLNDRRLNMVKKKKEEYDEDEELEEEEDEEEVEDDEEEPIPKKPMKPSKEQEPTKAPKLTITDVLQNHEQRILAIEASLFRIRNSA